MQRIFLIRTTILLFLFSAGINLYGQLNAAQTIETNSIRSDSAKAVILYQKAYNLFKLDSAEKALTYANESLKFSLRLNNKEVEISNLILIADIYTKDSKPEEAIPYYLRVTNILESQNDTGRLLNIYSAIADNYFLVSAYEKSGEYYQKAYIITNTADYENRVRLLEKTGISAFNYTNYDSAITCFSEILTLEQQTGKNDIKSLNLLVRTYNKLNQYQNALTYNQILFDRFEKQNDLLKMSTIKNNIAFNYTHLKDYEKAAESFIESIQYGEQAGISKNDFALLKTNIGICYQNLKNPNEAINYFQQSLNILKKTDFFSEKARVENILALIYFDKKDLYNAGFFSRQSIESALLSVDKQQLATCYNTYSKILKEGNDHIKALDYYEKYLGLRDSLLLEKKLEEKELVSKKYQLEKSEKELKLKLKEEEMKELAIKQLTLQLEKEAQEKELLISEKEVEQLEKERLKQSLEISKQRYEAAQQEREKKILEQDNRIKDFQLEQEAIKQKEQEQEIELLEHQKQLDQLKIERQETAKKTMIWMIVLVVVIAAVILVSLISVRKRNLLLAKQKLEIEEKNVDLEQKHEEIITQRDEIELQRDRLFEQKEEIQHINSEVTKSIEYARRIQSSALPDQSFLEKYVTDHFVFFKPRDIVSGDFYWFANVEKITIIVVADCTGHGVPGAFMSMLGMSLLKEIIVKEYITHPGVILRKMRKEIINALKQKGVSGEQSDGMDMALISLNHETNIMQFAGAYNPLYILREKKLCNNKNLKGFKTLEGDGHILHEIYADKMPIAIYDRMDKFFTHEIELLNGDLLYMFSDGYADQFGGPQGKKFKYIQFKRLILANANKSMTRQKESLDKTLEEWKGDLDQIDDIIVLGLRV